MVHFRGTNDEDVLGNAFPPADDLLEGFAAADRLHGFGGEDTLDGGLGADRMFGGAGADLYLVDNSADETRELDNQGIDRVEARVSFALWRAVENLTLIGAAPITGIGNFLDNRIAGNSGANLILGGLGDDELIGDGGDDPSMAARASTRSPAASATISIRSRMPATW